MSHVTRVMSHIWMWRVIHMNEACHTYERVMSHFVTHMNDFIIPVMSHIWMRHVISVNESRHTYEWVMSHIRMSHVTHTNKSCYTYEWVMSHFVTHMNESCQSSYVTHMNAARHTHEWIMPHTWICYVTHVNEPRRTHEWVPRTGHVTHVNGWHYEWITSHTHEWVTSHTWKSHVTHEWVGSQEGGSKKGSRHPTRINGSRHTWMGHVTRMNRLRYFRGWVTSHTWMGHVTHMNEQESGRRKQKGVYTSHTLQVGGHKVRVVLLDVRFHKTPYCSWCVTWLIHIWTCVPWLVHMCDMSYAHNASRRALSSDPLLFLVRDMTHSYINMCAETCSYLWHDSCT